MKRNKSESRSEYQQKKKLIQDRIAELRLQGRPVEDIYNDPIYKSAQDVIFEDPEAEAEMTARAPASIISGQMSPEVRGRKHRMPSGSRLY
jgi:hypothetical protein